MPINYGPYLSVLDPAGPVFIKIQAGVDPVVSANIGLFRANPAPPPPFIAVRYRSRGAGVRRRHGERANLKHAFGKEPNLTPE